MKTHLITIVLIGLLIVSCECNDDETQSSAGIEIYRTDTTYFHDIQKDYTTLDLDTIALEDTPLLRYEDLIKYDTSSHKLTMGFSHDSLKINTFFENFDVQYGSMFMVTLDNDPIYCGWFWSGHISRPCNWVYILEPVYELDSLEDNEIIIGFNYNSDYWQKYPDPRLDPRIIERLAKDGKIE